MANVLGTQDGDAAVGERRLHVAVRDEQASGLDEMHRQAIYLFPLRNLAGVMPVIS